LVRLLIRCILYRLPRPGRRLIVRLHRVLSGRFLPKGCNLLRQTCDPLECHGARRIKARMVDYGCCAHMHARAYLFGSLISLVRLSLWVSTWGSCFYASGCCSVRRCAGYAGYAGYNVVRVIVVRVLSVFLWISSRLREKLLYAGLAHGVWFPFFPFSLTQPFFAPPHQKRDEQQQQCLPNNKSFPLQALLHLLIRDLAMKFPPPLQLDRTTSANSARSKERSGWLSETLEHCLSPTTFSSL
jgi:hypothetical protein